MKAVILRAHFDGRKIVLDEPIKLKPNTKLMVTVLPEIESDKKKDKLKEERDAWLQISMKGLENVYRKDEIEYSMDLIKEPNPDYEGR